MLSSDYFYVLLAKTENKLTWIPSANIELDLKEKMTDGSKASAISCMQSYEDSSLSWKMES